ncbi:hypothetical protein D3C75_698740 [compost metagenome]
MFKRCSNFIFNDFNAGFTPHHVITIFHCANTTDIQTDRSVELQRVTTGSGFWVTKHHTNFHTNLVDEDKQGIGLLKVTCQFTHGLAHHTCRKAHVRVTDFAFNFSFRRQSSNGVNNQNVYRTRTCQRITNFQRLLASIWLGAQQVVDIYAQFLSVNRVQSVLGIDKRTRFTFTLSGGDNLQSQRRFTRRLWPVDFNDTPHWQATGPQSDIQ